eukprot:COSAG03_NODE_145_length_11619_cov_4.863281_2_plen_123_part_00
MARVEKGCSSANSGHWSSPLFLSYTALPSSVQSDELNAHLLVRTRLNFNGFMAGTGATKPRASPRAPARPPNQQLVEPPPPKFLPRLLPSYRSPCVCVCVSKGADADTHRASVCAPMCALGP